MKIKRYKKSKNESWRWRFALWPVEFGSVDLWLVFYQSRRVYENGFAEDYERKYQGQVELIKIYRSGDF